MTEPDDQTDSPSPGEPGDGPAHPRLEMEGPRVGELGHRRLPEMGALPYAGGSGRGHEARSRLVPVLAVAAAGGLAITGSVVWVANSGDGTPIAGDPRTELRPSELVPDTEGEAGADGEAGGSDEPGSTATPGPSETIDETTDEAADESAEPAAPSTTTEAPPATTEPPTTTGPAPAEDDPPSSPDSSAAPEEAPDGDAAEGDADAILAAPEAWFVEGELVLVGAVPDQRIADALTRKAAGVVGDDAVVDEFRIEPAAEVPAGLPVVVSERVEFGLESSEIEPRFLDLVGQWKAILEGHPDVRMTIVGHTDSTGPVEYNEWLSEQRAGAVAGWMQDQGIDGDRFAVEGMGPAKPIDDNDTPEGRARNRRIQVTLDGLLMV